MTCTQANPPPAFSIFSSGPESPPSVLTTELSSDLIYHKKGSNWPVGLKQIVLPIKRQKFQQLNTVIQIGC